jgi:hypothetical protein
MWKFVIMQVHLFACIYNGVTRIGQLEHQLEPFERQKEDTELNSCQDYCLLSHDNIG